MKYRKKPVIIDALKFDGTYTSKQEIDKFVDVSVSGMWHSVNNTCDYISIRTLEGSMRANPGDYIIKGVKGEFYPCKPDIFEASYEPVDEDREAMLLKPVLKKKDGDLYLTPKALDEIERRDLPTKRESRS